MLRIKNKYLGVSPTQNIMLYWTKKLSMILKNESSKCNKKFQKNQLRCTSYLGVLHPVYTCIQESWTIYFVCLLRRSEQLNPNVVAFLLYYIPVWTTVNYRIPGIKQYGYVLLLVNHNTTGDFLRITLW